MGFPSACRIGLSASGQIAARMRTPRRFRSVSNVGVAARSGVTGSQTAAGVRAARGRDHRTAAPRGGTDAAAACRTESGARTARSCPAQHGHRTGSVRRAGGPQAATPATASGTRRGQRGRIEADPIWLLVRSACSHPCRRQTDPHPDQRKAPGVMPVLAGDAGDAQSCRNASTGAVPAARRAGT
jgi:hypothetical protein